MEFSFKLANAGNYKALVWADFIDANAGTTTVENPTYTYTQHEDKYYDTNTPNAGLQQVTIKDPNSHDSFYCDAFCASIDLKKEVGALTESVELKRPFGQIIVLEKNQDLLKSLVEKTYITYSVPSQFNVMTNTVGEERVEKKVSTFPKSSPSDPYKSCFFYDYVFAPAEGQTSLGEIALTFDSKEPTTVVLNPFTIPANMPVVRNKRTVISGSILHTSPAPSPTVDLDVTISNGWTEASEDKDIDPKVGDYYYKNGTWSSTGEETAENPVVGVIYAVNTKDGNRIKVVALEEAEGAWCTTSPKPVTGATSMTNGKENTDKVLEFAATDPYSLEEFPIFKACADLRIKTGNVGWYIPADYNYLLTTIDQINSSIEAKGGTPLQIPTEKFYWTSWEEPMYSFAYVQHSATGASGSNKGISYKVRFLLDIPK